MLIMLLARAACVSVGVLTLLIISVNGIAPVLPYAGEIAFGANFAAVERGRSLFAYDVAREVLHPLTRAAAARYLPGWSADGDHLAYVTPIPLTQAAEQMFLTDIRAHRVSSPLLPSPLFGVLNSVPQVSPDGRYTAAVLADLRRRVLQVVWMRADGSVAQTADLHTSALFTQVTWSAPDTARVLRVSADAIEVYEQRADADLHLVQAWANTFVAVKAGAFAPDGERFVMPAIAPIAPNYELYLFDARDGTMTNISQRRQSNDSQPAWSPDGEQVAYKAVGNADSLVILTDADGGDSRVVFSEPRVFLSDLAWSPDGALLGFLVNAGGAGRLCLLDVAAETVACPVAAREMGELVWRPH